MVSLDDEGQTISLSDSDGENFLEITVQQGTVKIQGTSRWSSRRRRSSSSRTRPTRSCSATTCSSTSTRSSRCINTHIHPGEMALGVLPVTPMIPAVPLPPARAKLLSMRVTTG